jgi:hypothetical protein
MADKPDLEAELQFTRPYSQILLMLAVLGFVGLGVFVALPRVLPVFIQNPVLNGFIAFVFVIGVFSCFWQVGQLVISVRWIEGFLGHRETPQAATAPRLLAPLATLLRSRGARMQISATSTRSILDSVGTRIDEAREITRYVGNLLIFLGLLGTFYGLATTVPALVQTIGDLSPRPGESGQDVFNRLQEGLQAQMGGMGVAFASSLLGLAGSLIVGLLELFASHGQNRFCRELEEWLSSFTRVGFSEGEGGGDHGVVAGVMDHMAAQMEKLRDIFARGEASRGAVDDKLSQLADSLERMTDRLEASTPSTTAMLRLAESQERLVEVLENREASEGLDAESRMRLRSIDVQMLRILEEISAGRQESMAELRTDLSAIGRALSQMRLAPAPQPTTRRPPAKPEGREG